MRTRDGLLLCLRLGLVMLLAISAGACGKETVTPTTDASSPTAAAQGQATEAAPAATGETEATTHPTSAGREATATARPATSTPTPLPPAAGLIAFASDRDATWQVYVTNPDGSEQTNLSNTEFADFMPAWSPDGAQLLFASNRNGGSHLFTMQADGSQLTDLWEIGEQTADGDHPAWSPDGQRIVFASSQESEPELYLIQVDGTGLTRLTTNEHGAFDDAPSWSPDERIAFHTTRDGLGEIYVMNGDGSEQTNLTNTPEWDEWDPAYSPDGSQIAYVSYGDGDPEIYVMNADGSDPQQLTHNEVADEHPTWSPDGQWLAFQGDRGGNWEICVMRVDGSDETAVTNSPAADTSPAWWPVLPEPTATGQAQPTAEASATSRPRATPRPTVAGAQPSGGGLSSYRIHGERRENDSEGPTTSEWDLEVILSPLAYHLKSEGDAEMEVIVIEQTVWTRIGEQPWRQMDLPDDQSPDDLLGGETGVTVETDVPAEDSIAWLMGGHSLHIAQGSLTEAGSDTVNGVRCRRYTVDSQMSETVTMTVPVEATAVNTYVTQGELWVADEAGLPSFVVRARVTEAVTTEVGEASSTVTEYMEQDVTDVNGAIEIQPPM